MELLKNGKFHRCLREAAKIVVIEGHEAGFFVCQSKSGAIFIGDVFEGNQEELFILLENEIIEQIDANRGSFLNIGSMHFHVDPEEAVVPSTQDFQMMGLGPGNIEIIGAVDKPLGKKRKICEVRLLVIHRTETTFYSSGEDAVEEIGRSGLDTAPKYKQVIINSILADHGFGISFYTRRICLP